MLALDRGYDHSEDERNNQLKLKNKFIIEIKLKCFKKTTLPPPNVTTFSIFKINSDYSVHRLGLCQLILYTHFYTYLFFSFTEEGSSNSLLRIAVQFTLS